MTPDSYSLFVAATFVTGLGAILLGIGAVASRESFTRPWCLFAVFFCLGCSLHALRPHMPAALVIVVGTGSLLLAIGCLWIGARRLSLEEAPWWAAFIPPALWWIACLFSAVRADFGLRVWIGLSITIVVFWATAFSLWRAYGRRSLNGALAMALLILVVSMVPLLRLIGLLAHDARPELVSTAIVCLLLASSVPVLASTISAELREQRIVAAAAAGRAEMQRLHDGMPAVVMLWAVAKDGSSSLTYSGGDVDTVLGHAIDSTAGAEQFTEAAEEASEPVRRLLMQAVANGCSTHEYPAKSGDASWRWLRVTCRRLSIQPNGNAEVVSHMVDISAQRLVAAVTVNTSRLNSLSAWATGLSHELMQPLQSLTTGAEVAAIEAGRLGTDLLSNRLAIVVEEARRAASVVDALREFANWHGGRAKLSATRLQPLIERTKTLLGGLIISRNVTVHWHEQASNPAVLIDEVAMQHILVHVFINAFDSMASMAEGRPRRLDIYSTQIPDQERIRLCIHDSGPGFADEILATAFEPFVTSSNVPDRNGLGLHFCRTWLSAMDGTISACNGEGGAVVCIELPVADLPP